MMRAVLMGPESCPYAKVLESKLATRWELTCIDHADSTDSKCFMVADALIAITFNASLPAMPELKLIQAPSTGLNSIDFAQVPPGVSVCNSYGHEVAIAEYNILAMLASAHNLIGIHLGFVKGQWYWSRQPIHPTHTEVSGKTVCIVGLGRIGTETAKRAKALGMYVVGCNRTQSQHIACVDELTGLDDLRRQVSRSHFVILCCALTDETRNMVDSTVFACMGREAFFINVSRSGLVSEADLYSALSTRQIAGAVLDVWYRYPGRDDPHPAPSAFPFHELDNVIMTPHVSGWTDGMVDRRWTEIARNLDNLALGQPLINLVVGSHR